MIVDILDNAERYESLQTGFAEGFAFLRRPDLSELTDERYDIDGDRVFAIVSNGPGRGKEGALLETHRRYIDIQYVIDGNDEMGWKPHQACKQPTMEYDSEKDYQLFADMPDIWLNCSSNTFAIFFPEDGHMPNISPGNIHKIILKIAVDSD